MLAYGGQLNLMKIGVFNIIKADNGQLLWNLYIMAAAVIHKTNGEEVIGQQNGGGTARSILGKELFSGFISGFQAPVFVIGAVFFLIVQMVIGEGLAESPVPIIRGGGALVMS